MIRKRDQRSKRLRLMASRGIEVEGGSVSEQVGEHEGDCNQKILLSTLVSNAECQHGFKPGAILWRPTAERISAIQFRVSPQQPEQLVLLDPQTPVATFKFFQPSPRLHLVTSSLQSSATRYCNEAKIDEAYVPWG